MMDFENKFIWNDGICVDNNKGWFVGCQVNALFEVNFEDNNMKLLAKFPDTTIEKFREISICKKYKDSIYCFPDCGKQIWVYDILKKTWQKIEIENLKGKRWGIMNAFLCENHFFAVSICQKKIIEIDALKKQVINCYPIFSDMEDKMGWECIEVENGIYCVSRVSNVVCRFDMQTKRIDYYELSGIEGKGFHTICFSDGKFWLSGNQKTFVVWDKKNNQVNTINYMIDDFCAYQIEKEPQLFLSSVSVQKKIWYIPYWANKILYIDKEKLKVHSYEIPEEIETEQDIMKRSMRHKYILESVTDGRFIWLYSFKNERTMRIDTLQRNMEFITLQLCDKSKDALWTQWAEEKKWEIDEISTNSIHRLIASIF